MAAVSDYDRLKHEQQALESALAATHNAAAAATLRAPLPQVPLRTADRAHHHHTQKETEPILSPAEAADRAHLAAAEAATARRAASSSRAQALRRYFDAMSDYPGYTQRRGDALKPAPFSFDRRESVKLKTTMAEKRERYRMERKEAEERELNAKFRANPVPPSTYLPKYEMMVDEWCAQKEAARDRAERKAKEMLDNARPGEEFAVAMAAAKRQQAKNPTAVRAAAATLSAKASAKALQDAAHEEWRAKHCQQFRAKPAPEFAKPGVAQRRYAEAEEARSKRVQRRAEVLLAASKAPPRLQAQMEKENTNNSRSRSAKFGAAPKGRPSSAAPLRPVTGQASCGPVTDADGAASASALVRALLDEHAGPGSAAVAAVGEGRRELTPEEALALATAEQDQADEDDMRSMTNEELAAAAREELQQRNPAFTFQPKVKATVPPFEVLHMREQLRLTLRRQQRPPTDVEGFRGMQHRSEDARLKREARATRAAIVDAEKKAQRRAAEQREADRRANVRQRAISANPRTAKAGEPAAPLPTATKAHVLKAEAAYRLIVQRDDEDRQQKADDDARAKNRRETGRRLREDNLALALEQGLLADEAADKDMSTDEKLRRKGIDPLMPTFLREERRAQAKFAAEAAVRRATDDELLAVLKQHGLGGKTLKDVVKAAGILDGDASVGGAAGNTGNTGGGDDDEDPPTPTNADVVKAGDLGDAPPAAPPVATVTAVPGSGASSARRSSKSKASSKTSSKRSSRSSSASSKSSRSSASSGSSSSSDDFESEGSSSSGED